MTKSIGIRASTVDTSGPTQVTSTGYCTHTSASSYRRRHQQCHLSWGQSDSSISCHNRRIGPTPSVSFCGGSPTAPITATIGEPDRHQHTPPSMGATRQLPSAATQSEGRTTPQIRCSRENRLHCCYTNSMTSPTQKQVTKTIVHSN